jgi:hypothetical protein
MKYTNYPIHKTQDEDKQMKYTNYPIHKTQVEDKQNKKHNTDCLCISSRTKIDEFVCSV